MRKFLRKSFFVAWGLLFCVCLNGYAQDLEPRLLSVAPANLKFALLTYGYSSGNILLDPSLPMEGVNARIHSVVPAYAMTFGMLGRLAKLDVIMPFSSGIWRGNLSGVDTSTQRKGVGDPLVRLGVNLIGTPAMSFEELRAHKETFQLGASLRVRVPLGSYNPEKFFNMGTNRWAFQFQLGSSYRIKRWIAELHLSSWLFTPNNQFFPDNEIRQKALFTIHFHMAYVLKSGIWVAVSYGKNAGGSTFVNGAFMNNPQDNNRFGMALNYPLGKRHSLRLVFTSGIVTRFGSDFDRLLLIYQLRLWPGSGKKQQKG